MRILFVAQYFKPESVGAAIWIHQMAVDLVERGHEVEIVTAFPNYPDGVIFPPYRGRVFQRERIDGVGVIRTYIFASPPTSGRSKLLSFGSFSASAMFGGLAAKRPDVIYAILPPLPLGLTANWLGLLKRAPTIVNVQDVWPDAPLAAGILPNNRTVGIFRAMERAVYRGASLITVISEGFRRNLLQKGVLASKLAVVPNWADPQEIRPGPKENGFRRELGIGPDRLCLVYSGSLSYNSSVETAIEAMALLRDEPVTLVIVGDGVKRDSLQGLAQKHELRHVRFIPFQPWQRYPEVLAAADVCLVTLGSGFSFASVPSKTFKIMAAARPVLALAAGDSDLAQLVAQNQCGLCVPPEDAQATAEALRGIVQGQGCLDGMGKNGRAALERDYSRHSIVSRIEALMRQVTTARGGEPAVV